MNKLTVFFILMCSFIGISYGMSDKEIQELSWKMREQYIKKYPCPPSLQTKITRVGYFQRIFGFMIQQYKKTSAYTIRCIPNFLFKNGMDRLTGADILKSTIDKKNLNLLFVPQKYACWFANKPLVVAEEVTSLSNKPLNLEQVTQLCTLIKKTWYFDTISSNIKKTTDGKVAIIDTELRGFGNEKYDRIYGFNNLSSAHMDKDARQYLQKEMRDECDNIALRAWVKEELYKEGSLDLLKIYKERQTRDFNQLIHNTFS